MGSCGGSVGKHPPSDPEHTVEKNNDVNPAVARVLSTSPLAPELPAQKIELRVRCSDGQQFSVNAGTVKELLSEIATRCKVHQSCVLLTYAGRRFDMEPTKALINVGAKKKLKAGVQIFATVVKDTFPEKIGPFETVKVPIEGKAFRIRDAGGGNDVRIGDSATWTVLGRSARQWGLTIQEQDLLFGQTSPGHPITLRPNEKEAANIPIDATQFYWSYQMAEMGYGSAQNPVIDTFFKLGGYMYVNSQGWLLQATTLMPSDSAEGGGLQFEEPRPWEHSWTLSLWRQGRFYDITIPAWTKIGATHYCWLAPGEIIYDDDGNECPTQPKVSHGAFAYLFHADKSQSTGNQMDRYFAIVSGEKYQVKRGASKELPPTNSLRNGHSFLDENRDRFDNSEVKDIANTQGAALERPTTWDHRSGLVRLDASELQEFQTLLDRTTKRNDNWTRDRGCAIHGVNNCDPPCIFRNKAPVPTKYTVVEVWKNQNAELWKTYAAMRAVINVNCRNTAQYGRPDKVSFVSCNNNALAGERLDEHEWWLFHGSGKGACNTICSANFELDMAGAGNTWKAGADAWGMPLYGFGHYFAEHITKADEYAKDDGGVFTVLLCRVCGGRPHTVTANTINPDELQKEVYEGRAHSVVGDRVSVLKKPFKEVVVYDSSQIFPEFLIKYRRSM